MNIPKEVYKYIEHELACYEDYKAQLELERERIIESSPYRVNGMPRRSDKSGVALSVQKENQQPQKVDNGLD